MCLHEGDLVRKQAEGFLVCGEGFQVRLQEEVGEEGWGRREAREGPRRRGEVARGKGCFAHAHP